MMTRSAFHMSNEEDANRARTPRGLEIFPQDPAQSGLSAPPPTLAMSQSRQIC